MSELPTLEAKIQFLATSGAAAVHMLSNPLSMELGREILTDLRAWRAQNMSQDELQKGREILRAQRKAKNEANDALMRRIGPGIWKNWHRRAVGFAKPLQKAQVAKELAWIEANVTSAIPCGKCKAHFVQLLKEHFPAGFSDYFAATVEIHNHVNERLDKPKVTVSEARDLHSEAVPVQTSGDPASGYR